MSKNNQHQRDTERPEELKAFIEERTYVKKGSVILSKDEYIEHMLTHCRYCQAETHEKLIYFGEIICRDCKAKFDPENIYDLLKQAKVTKWQIGGRK